jgi:hypothetical protein
VSETGWPYVQFRGGLPDPSFQVLIGQIALVVTPPQNDFLRPDSVVRTVERTSVPAVGKIDHVDVLRARDTDAVPGDARNAASELPPRQ